MFLNDSFTRNNQLKTTFFHHEQACAMAAEGYARISGQCQFFHLQRVWGNKFIKWNFWTWRNLPIFVVSGQVRTETLNRNKHLRQLGDQEAPIVEIVKTITKYSKTIDNPNQIDFELNKAYNLATEGRPGPVWLDIPINIQSQAYEIKNQIKGNAIENMSKIANKDVEFEKLYKMINKSKRPAIIAGDGIN